MPGTLSIAATPIGNLEDITLRALRLLKEADLLICEDTRVTQKLLKAYELTVPLATMHQHTVEAKLRSLLQQALDGKKLVYVTDAGTPGMNDPGGKLVELAYEMGVRIEPIPGSSALTAAISVCGFPMDEFYYLGFLPHKKGRQTAFRQIAEREVPTVLLESTHRIEKALASLEETLDPKRHIFIGRELTKQFETLYRGTVTEVRKQLARTSTKGEFILIIGPAL